MRGRAAGAGLLVLAGALVAPSTAAGHGLVGKQDLPIPLELFAGAAAAVLVLSFVLLALLWPRPRLEQVWARRLGPVPSVVDVVCGALGIALFAVVVYSGLAGVQVGTANLAPTFIYVLFWVGLVVVSLVFGDVFRLFNPWRAIARFFAWVASRLARGGLPDPLPYPERLGHWPAVAGLLGFAWLELVYSGRDDPSTLAVLALAYAAVQLAGMALYGIEAWTDRGDSFSVYFGLFARLSVWERREGSLWFRAPLAGSTRLEVLPGTVLLLCMMIGTTAFDGLSEGPLWSSVAPELQQLFADLGAGLDTALELSFTIGLAVSVGFVFCLYRLGIEGMRLAGGGESARTLARTFVHSLVPIAAAYVIAHYFSLLAYQGQAAAFLASNPLGEEADLFGTASYQIDYTVVSANGIWYVQVAALVVGHVAALVLAHDRALARYGSLREATRSQYWMLGVMVSFTFLGLWLLSAAN